MTSDRQRNYYQARSRSKSLPEVDRIWRWVGRNDAGMGIVQSDRGDTRIGIVSGNAAVAVGRPVLYIPPAPGQPFGAIQLPTVLTPAPIIRTTPPTGFWIYGGFEGAGLAIANTRNTFQFQWGTAPQTIQDEFSEDVETTPGSGIRAYTINYRTYYVDWLFAQSLDLAEATTVTSTGYQAIAASTLTRISSNWRAFEISSLIGLTTVDQIVADCLDAYNTGRLFTGIDTANGATAASPWNRANLVNGIPSTIGEPDPLYGIQSVQLLQSTFGSTETSNEVELTAGTWLILGFNWRSRIAQPYLYSNISVGYEFLEAQNAGLAADEAEAIAPNTLYASIQLS